MTPTEIRFIHRLVLWRSV